jgi:hypothetical protein
MPSVFGRIAHSCQNNPTSPFIPSPILTREEAAAFLLVSVGCVSQTDPAALQPTAALHQDWQIHSVPKNSSGEVGE